MNNLLLPIKIIKEYNVVNSTNLFVRKETQINLNETNFTTFTKGSYIILDFGKEIAGGIRILTKDATNKHAIIHIRFGESVGECSAKLGYKNATNDHSTRDIYYDIPFLSDITVGSTGFRFVRIDVEEDVTLTFKNIYAVEDELKQIDGYFKSDDELLNQIFDIAAYTNALCHKNGYYYDGIKRDRLVWIGDSYPIYRSSKYLYLDDKEIINSLKFATIESPLPMWVNYSPMYSFWWMLLLAEYYLDTHDDHNVMPLLDYLIGIINQSAPLIDEKGNLLFDFLFIDWPSHYDVNEPLGNDILKKEDEIAGCNFLITITLNKVLEAFKDKLNETIQNLIKSMLNRLKNGKNDVKKFIQIASLGVIAGYKDKNKEEVLLSNNSSSISTFMSYFIFKAFDILGHHAESVKRLKQYYGKMIEIGATTFFEDFDLSWANNVTKLDELPSKDKKDFHGDHGAYCYTGYRHSLCHGWSSGVVAYIYEYIVGIKQIDKNHYCIKPMLGDIKDLNCAFATKEGLVKLEFKNGKLVRIDKPDSIIID